MKTICTYALAALLFSCFSSSGLFSQRLLPFDSTITHRMLLIDAKLYDKNDAEIRLCKELMEKACLRILKRYPRSGLSKAGFKEGKNILSMIDSTFTEFDFLFSTSATDVHYDVLSFALRDKFHQEYYRTDYQENYWRDKAGRSCRLIDCDQYCRIYIGIAQMLRLPVSVVHIPGHYYLHWNLPNGTHFSWNPNDATAHVNDSTMELYRDVAVYNKKNGDTYFPKVLTTSELLGNYYTLLSETIWDEHPAIDAFRARECLPKH